MSESGLSMSPAINEIAAALAKAQGKMASAKKDAENPFFKSKYADLASVYDACRAALSENGIAVIQPTDDTDGSTVVVHTILAHASGQWISSTLRLRPVKGDPQGIGSAITYARRYGVSTMVGVATEDDDGEAASGKGKDVGARKPQAASPAPVASAVAPGAAPGKQVTAPERAAAAGKPVAAAATAAREDATMPGHVKRFFGVAGELGISEDDQKRILGEFQIASRKDITAAQLPAIIRRMEEWVGVAPPDPTPDEAPPPPPPHVAGKPPALISIFDVKRVTTKLDEVGATPNGPCVACFIGRRVNDVRQVTRDELPDLLKLLDAIAAKDEGALKLLASAKSTSVPF